MENYLETYLTENRINYKIHRHKAVHTVAESSDSEDIKKISGLHCKTLFLRDDERFYLIGMPANKRLDMKKLERHLKVKKLKFGSESDLKKFNLVAGSVSIFGAICAKEIILILDKDVWDADVVGFHPNINTETLEIKHDDLERYYNSLGNKKEVVEL